MTVKVAPVITIVQVPVKLLEFKTCNIGERNKCTDIGEEDSRI